MNPSLTRSTAIVAVLALTACTTPIRDQSYVATASARIPEAQARSECQFQVEAATASIGTERLPRDSTIGNAISDGIADGVERSDKENTLFKSCMGSKGFVSA